MTSFKVGAMISSMGETATTYFGQVKVATASTEDQVTMTTE